LYIVWRDTWLCSREKIRIEGLKEKHPSHGRWRDDGEYGKRTDEKEWCYRREEEESLMHACLKVHSWYWNLSSKANRVPCPPFGTAASLSIDVRSFILWDQNIPEVDESHPSCRKYKHLSKIVSIVRESTEEQF